MYPLLTVRSNNISFQSMMHGSHASRLGKDIAISTVGEAAKACVPPLVPPEPPVDLARMYAKIDRATSAVGRLDGLANILPDAAPFTYAYARKEAILSCQIEGLQSSLPALLLNEATGASGVSKDDVLEAAGCSDALRHGSQRISGGSPVSRRLLCELHAMLFDSGRDGTRLPGEFRRSQNWIGGMQLQDAVYVPPPARLVPDLVSDLERFMQANDPQLPILVRAGMAHVQFETIHPFVDGNGRIGRLLITLLLLSSGILSQPLLYLSLFLKAHRSRYYDLLQRVRTHGDWEAWLEFFLDGVIATASHAAETARDIQELHRTDREMVSQLGRPAGSALRVYRLLQERPIITASGAAKELGISLPTVWRSLGHLERLGVIREITGKQRGRAFAYEAYLDRLSRGIEPVGHDQGYCGTTEAQGAASLAIGARNATGA